jgi:hypothetical protein
MHIRRVAIIALMSSVATVGIILALQQAHLNKADYAPAKWEDDQWQDYPEDYDHQGHEGLGQNEVGLYNPASILEACSPKDNARRFDASHGAGGDMSGFTEVHAVGLYGGVAITDIDAPEPTDPKVNVCVDRPGESVLLLLGAYEPIHWTIDVSEGTELSGIVLQGNFVRQSRIMLSGEGVPEVHPPYRTHPDVIVPHNNVGGDYRSYVADMIKQTGVDRLSSFQGMYNATASGFLINEVDTDTPSLALDPLADMISGHDRLTDPLASVLAYGPPPSAWRITNDGIAAAGTDIAVSAPKGVAMSWPAYGIAEDPDNRHLFIARSYAENHIYRIELNTGRWGTIHRERAAQKYGGLIWDDQRKRLLMTSMPQTDLSPVILEIDTNTGQSILVSRLPNDMPGIEDLFDARTIGKLPEIKPIALDGDLILLRGEPNKIISYRPGQVRPTRTWLHNMTTGETHLVAYTDEGGKYVFTPDEETILAIENLAVSSGSIDWPTEGSEEPDSAEEDDVFQSKVDKALAQIESITAGTRSIFSSRGSYRAVTASILSAAGLMPNKGIHPWGQPFKMEGTSNSFTIELNGVPQSDCKAMMDALSNKPDVLDAVCRGRTLKYVTR